MNNIEISKYLSYILRHKPEIIKLKLDKEGWGDIQYIIDNSEMKLSYDIIKEIVDTNDKQRFSISEDGTKIRANQGHTIKNVNIHFKKSIPPTILYHGTKEEFLSSILKKGLLPMERQYVHLSQNYDTALKVGLRHGEAIVLKISAQEMVHNGMEFFKSENGIYLTKYVPNNYITVLENAKLKIKQKKL